MNNILRRPKAAALCLAVLLMSGATDSHAQVANVPSQLRLPSEVRIFLSVPDAAAARKKWKSTTDRILNDPEFAESKREVERNWEELSKKVEAETGVPLDRLLELPRGELSLAVWVTEGRRIAAAAIIDYGDNRETVDALLKAAHTSLTRRGLTRADEEFEGTKLVIYTQPAAPADENLNKAQPPVVEKPAQSMGYFVRDGRLVVGNGRRALQDVLARWDGQHARTLAGNNVYKEIAARCSDPDDRPAATWFVDPIGLLQYALTGDKASFESQIALAFLPQLGLDSLRGIGGSFDFGTNKYESISRTLVYVEQPSRELMKLFVFPSAEQSPPAWVAASSSSYFAANWNAAGAYEAVETLYDRFRGPGAFGKLIDQAVEQGDGPKFHPKKDLVDQLTGKLHLVTEAAGKANDPADAAANEAMIVALEIKDPEKISALLTELAQTPAFTGKKREFRSYTIYELPAGPGNAEGTTLGMTVFGNSLLTSSDVGYLEQTLTGGRESLTRSPRFQRIAAEFPAKTSIAGFRGHGTQLRPLYEVLRSGNPRYQIAGMDLTGLPPFSSFEKHLQPAGTYIVPDRNGAYIVSFSLKP